MFNYLLVMCLNSQNLRLSESLSEILYHLDNICLKKSDSICFRIATKITAIRKKTRIIGTANSIDLAFIIISTFVNLWLIKII